MDTNEIWSDINYWKLFGYFQISNCGRFKRLARETIRKNGNPLRLKEKIVHVNPNFYGYMYCSINIGGENKYLPIHRLVALSFIPNNDPEKYPDINHKDGNKQNNHVSNLEWTNDSLNVKHAYDTGLKKPKYGVSCNLSVLTEFQVSRIREMNKRGVSRLTLSKIFNITKTAIRYIVTRKTWAHLE